MANFFKFNDDHGTGKFINLDFVTFAEYNMNRDHESPELNWATVHLYKGSINQIIDIKGPDVPRLVAAME